MCEERQGIVFKVPVYIEEDNGGFHAYSPILKGLHTSGDTLEEAKENAKDAVIAYLESLISHGDSIPLCIIEKPKPSLKNLFGFKANAGVISESLIEVTV